MKRNILFATSLIAMGAFTAPAFAESPAQAKDPDSTGQTQINSGTQQLNAEPGATDSGVTASTSSDMNSFVTVLGTGTTTAGTIGSMTEVSTITVVKTADWASADQQAYDAALSQNAQPISDLQAAVAANAPLSAELAKNNIRATDVVATQINADGSMTVYVR